MAGLRELVVGVLFIFVLGVFMLVAGPVVDGVSDATDMEPVGDKSVGFDPSAKVDLVKNVSLVLVPTFAGAGFILWVYAAVTRSESYSGRM
jgi:hypothetical protein